MNKLIIIGNGFDLAHGYPTRYSDFILWLVKKELKTVYESRRQSYRRENPLFHCIVNTSIYEELAIDRYLEENLLSIIQSSSRDVVLQVMFPGQRRNSERSHDPFTINPKNDFSKKLLKNTCENWVDIEQTYYKCLKEILNNSIKNGSHDFQETLTELNLQLSYLCEQLRNYLVSLPKDAFIPEFGSILNREIDYSELFKPDDWKKQIDIDLEELAEKSKTFILNFNYTDTVEQYFSNADNTVVINNIHGSIIDDGNPMIFGYGDELDDDFSLMEKQELKGFLEHVKSLWYLRTRNYHNLIRFIESGYYQVQILGHSCGRSDRTLLNMVFEHDHCNSVDIYYRSRSDGTDSFNEISEEVSRQFKDKQKLRKRVLPKNSTNVIPQFIEVTEEKIA